MVAETKPADPRRENARALAEAILTCWSRGREPLAVLAEMPRLEPERPWNPEQRALLRGLAAGLVTLDIQEASVWAVESESRAGVGYAVKLLAEGRSSCTCEAGRRGDMCKHVALARHRRRQRLSAGAAPESQLAPEPETPPAAAPVANGHGPVRSLEDLYR